MGVNLALKHSLGLQHEDCSVRDTITRVMRSTRESTSSKRGPNPIPLVRKARDLLNKDKLHDRNTQTALLTRPNPHPWHRKDTSQNLAKTCKWTGYTFLSHARTLRIRLIQQSHVPRPGYGYPVTGWAPLITGLSLSSSPNCSDEWSTQRPQLWHLRLDSIYSHSSEFHMDTQPNLRIPSEGHCEADDHESSKTERRKFRNLGAVLISHSFIQN